MSDIFSNDALMDGCTPPYLVNIAFAVAVPTHPLVGFLLDIVDIVTIERGGIATPRRPSRFITAAS